MDAQFEAGSQLHIGVSANDRALLLESAYDDYCRQNEQSKELNIETFLNRYSSIKSSLRRQIQVHQVLEAHPKIRELCQTVDWPEPGSKIFEFSVVEELGRGAFARVYLCSQSGLGERQVVVKLAMEGTIEAELLGQLSHQNIMPVYSIAYDDLTGTSAICMPFRGRRTVADLIDLAFADGTGPTRGRIIHRAAQEGIQASDRFDDIGEMEEFYRRSSYVDGVAYLGLQLAEGIAHAHARGIWHGDLKPSNILLTPTGRPLIMDFNLAHGEASPAVSLGGTVPYMSPEQLACLRCDFQSSPTTLDGRSDIFSLAVILFELLSGRLPFGEPSTTVGVREQASKLSSEQQRGSRSLRAANRRVDRRLAELIEQCLSFDRDLRPPTADILAVELRRCLSPVRRRLRWSSVHRIRTSVATGVFVLACASSGAYLAARDSYPARQYKLALAEYARGDGQTALFHINQVIGARPNCADAYYFRGCAHCKHQEYDLALRDFEAAAVCRAEGRFFAAQAYCLCRLGLFRAASQQYRRALDTGYRQVDAYNNFARCRIREGQFTEARTLLDAAARQDPNKYQVFLNRVVMEIQLRYVNPTHDLTKGLDDSKRVLALAPPSAQLELLVARLFAMAGHSDPAHREESLSHLETACARGLGISRKSLAADPDFIEVQTSPRFIAVLERLSSTNKDSPPEFLISPAMRPAIPTEGL